MSDGDDVDDDAIRKLRDFLVAQHHRTGAVFQSLNLFFSASRRQRYE
jgi:hypothetical protein